MLRGCGGSLMGRVWDRVTNASVGDRKLQRAALGEAYVCYWGPTNTSARCRARNKNDSKKSKVFYFAIGRLLEALQQIYLQA